jgi:hypothetical protein
LSIPYPTVSIEDHGHPGKLGIFSDESESAIENGSCASRSVVTESSRYVGKKEAATPCDDRAAADQSEPITTSEHVIPLETHRAVKRIAFLQQDHGACGKPMEQLP